MIDSFIKGNHKDVRMWNKNNLSYTAEQMAWSIQTASPKSISCHSC